MATLPYRYSPLTFQKPEIRLATLHPGQVSDNIVISLDSHKFSDNHKPNYEAVSYVWGSMEHQEMVYILEPQNSNNCDPTLKGLLATKNLCSALRHLRLSQQPRVLWVDALCIDVCDVLQANFLNRLDLQGKLTLVMPQQGSHLERSEEVGRMGNIFALADRVLVWLGLPTSDSDLAIKMIESLSTGINLIGNFDAAFVAGSYAESYRCDAQNAAIMEPLKWASLNNFFQRPWFSRLWIRQEAMLASRIQVILGYSEISWESLAKTVRLLIFIAGIQPRAWDLEELSRIHSLFLRDGNRNSNLFNLLQTSSNSNYLNPRDIVYANLSMSPGIKRLNIQPDYDKSPEYVYRDIFFKHVQTYGVLDLMLLCDIRNISPGLPSFIPNFSIPTPSNYHISNHAAVKTSQIRDFLEGDILPLKGIKITTVRDVKHRAPSKFSNLADILGTCRAWVPNDLRSATYCCGGSLADAYYCTVNGSFGRDGMVTSASSKEAEELKELLISLWSSKDHLKLSSKFDMQWHGRNLRKHLPGRSFFETTDGYIGTSPADVKPDDKICVLLGGEAPFILRQLPDDSSYQVVGPCYLHGIMFGEAFLGAIPEPWVCDQDTDSGQWQFTDRETGKRTFEDPRLWPLPPEWELHYCDEDGGCCSGNCVEENEKETGFVFPWYYNNVTGEEVWDDPRLSVSGLREHGVTIEEFVLV